MNFGVSKAAKLVLVPRFDLKMVLEAIQKEKPTAVPGRPPDVHRHERQPDAGEVRPHERAGRVSGAAPLPLSVAQRFEERTGTGRVVEGYGLTECSPVTHANPLVGERKEGSIGMPVPDTDVKLVDLENPDVIVAQGERGEMCVRGPQIMLGYWNKPEATALMIRDGWLHTGDVAVMDTDGYFRIVDRIKDMILVSGFNVYPTEIEDRRERSGERRRAGRIVYLGGLGADDPDASPHLRSRRETGERLASAGVPVTTLRAAMIIGKGSAAFETILDDWAAGDGDAELGVDADAADRARRRRPLPGRHLRPRGRVRRGLRHGRAGGDDLPTDDRADRCPARAEAGVVEVPVLTPYLSSLWLNLVTPVNASVARPLVEGLRNPTIAREERIRKLLPLELTPFDEATRQALA